MKNLMIVKLDTEYCNYLRKFDKKVPFNMGKKELRPFVGVLFQINDCMYFAPLSSPKPKHLKLKNNIDFLKLDGGKLGVINFNNMLPVMSNNFTEFDLNKKSFSKTEKDYINLLRKQNFWLNRNRDKLYSKSTKLYNKYIGRNLNKNILSRCCDFQLLEEKCMEYNRKVIFN